MRHLKLIAVLTASLAIGACAGDATTSPAQIDTPTVTPNTEAVTVVSPNNTQAAMVGVPFTYDATNLPFQSITFLKSHKAFRFTVDTVRYEWTLATETLKSNGRVVRNAPPPEKTAP